MRVKSKRKPLLEADLTPMIDMTFQLIAFFMVLINFSQTESHERVQLPSSELVRPPESPIEYPIILHIANDGTIIMGGEEHSLETLRLGLRGELAVLRAQNRTPADANVIIRAHRDAATGEVQEVIRVTQEQGVENFALRVKEDVL